MEFLESLAPGFIFALGFALILIGYLGALLPGLPGPPIAYGSLLLIHFTGIYPFSTFTLVLWGFFTILVTLLDYIVPIYGTKLTGGTKKAMTGSTVGLIAGLILTSPLGPFAIILGPFLGALVFEMLGGKKFSEALPAALGALLGFLTGAFAKIVFITFLLIIYIVAVVKSFASF